MEQLLTYFLQNILLHKKFCKIFLENLTSVMVLHNSLLDISRKREGAIWEATWRIHLVSDLLQEVCPQCSILLGKLFIALKMVEANHQIRKARDMTFNGEGP